MAAVLKKGAWLAILAIFKARDLKLGILIEEHLRKKQYRLKFSKWPPFPNGGRSKMAAP